MKVASPKILSFKDFQRMLRHTEGKPIYKKVGSKYILDWTVGSFQYQTEITAKQIHDSYEEQYGKKNDKASIEMFFKIYLQDAYEERTAIDDKEKVNLVEGVDVIKEAEEKPEDRWKYKEITPLNKTQRKSAMLKPDGKGGFVITAIDDKNNVVTMMEIKRKEGRLVEEEQKTDKSKLIKEKIESVN